MECHTYWFYYLLSAAACAAVALYLRRSSSSGGGSTAPPELPPGPSALASTGLLFFLGRGNFSTIMRLVRARYGPVFTLRLKPSQPTIFVSDRAAAHRALVQGGALLADRPPAGFSNRVLFSDQHSIASCGYGPLWSALRRNLTGRVLHPLSLQRFAGARRRAAAVLVAGVTRQMDGVVVIEALLHRALYHVLVSMCFGDAAGEDDGVVAAVEAVQREFTTSVIGFQVLDVYTALAKLVFWRTWKHLQSLRRRQEELFIPLIQRARSKQSQGRSQQGEGADGVSNGGGSISYVESLLSLRVPEASGGGGSRKLTDGETVSLCSEFLAAGTDSTAAVVQWVMASLVAQTDIQTKLRAEIQAASNGAGVREDDLHKMPYLKAVVLEALRRHPPAQLVMPHAATDDGTALIDGFLVPRHASVNFTTADMALDERVWGPDARRFRPGRFLPGGVGADVQLTGAKEIKMIPFGAGRRACPGIELSLLHLEFMVATLVAGFEWQAAEKTVDLAERLELSIVMRTPLRALVVPCRSWIDIAVS